MDDELLSGILAAEREIRLRIDDLEEQVAQDLQRLQQELDTEEANAAKTLQNELAAALHQAEAEAQQEAKALLDQARSAARRLEDLDSAELDRVVGRHLVQILPAGAE